MRVAIILLILAGSASAQSFEITGSLSARGVNATGPESWLASGFGRLDSGADRSHLLGVAHMGLDWQPARWLELHVSGTGRRAPEEEGGTSAGLVEAYAALRYEIALDELQLKAGSFFLPTSRENVDNHWTSPYTIHFSALNTWIAHEVRPIGADLQYRHTTNAGHAITGGVTAFRGNDTMGTLLGWRGWTVGDRIVPYGEVLPLPPLGSLADDGPFWRQRDDGTQPFGPDLDGRTGYSARLRYRVPERGLLQYTWVDNGGDRALYGDEYSWDTRFHLISAELGDRERLLLASEVLRGETNMGLAFPSVGAGFQAAYLLISQKAGRNRWTARYDLFSTEERDNTTAEQNDESGRSWTLTWMFDVTPRIRAAAEFTQVTGNRPAASQYGFEPSTTGHSVTFEVRYAF